MKTCAWLVLGYAVLSLALEHGSAADTNADSAAQPSPSLSEYYRQRAPDAARVAKGKSPWVLFRTLNNETTQRIDRAFAPSDNAWIDAAWATMEMKTGVIPKRDHEKVAGAILELWRQPPENRRYYGHKGLQGYVASKHGMQVAGNIMIARTNPTQRQQMAVRKKLLKMIWLVHEFQQIMLETAEQHTTTVMPGYTHIRHAQPTTFGHYLLSVYDPIERSVTTLEDGYRAMSLNELGCGALAGTSFPIDRDMVSAYLGLEGLIENTNDAVSYSDGYVTVVAAAANIMTVLSRMGMELDYWSTLEYDFLDFELGAGSFMMPNKRSNQTYLESTAIGASKTLGALTEVTSMGMKMPHGDMQTMAYHMDDATLNALEQIDTYVEPYLYHLPTMIVHKERMLARAREGYSCSTELANVLVREHDLDYRTAHDVVNKFVVDSAQQGVPSSEASIKLFQVAAQEVIGRQLSMSEEDLRRTLDPVHFVEVTNSRGGVAPAEVARMIAERQKKLADARSRHATRIGQIERAKAKMLSDLEAIVGVAVDPADGERTVFVSSESPVDTTAQVGQTASSRYDGMKISEALSTLAIETKTDEISDEAYTAAKTAVLDALGCAFAGHDAPGVPAVVELTHHWGGQPEATVWFHGGKVPGPAAAYANSVQVHALDLDDVHIPSITHITSVVVPAALAMGELHGASGKDTLAAVIMGIDVAGRLGRACRARTAHEGFLPTSTVGGFGATAAACRLQGCSVDETANAMGIWYAHCSGNRQALYDRTLTKRIQPAIAARAGVYASYLAGKDFTGPRRIIGNQPASLTKIYGFDRDATPPTMDEIMGPRDFYEVELLSYKRYACCGASHMAVESALGLANEHDLKPDDIESICIFGVGVNSGMTGVPWKKSDNPHVLAQFCAPYEVASVIKNRRFGPAEITNRRIAEDKEVDALARRTKLCHWSEWGGPRPAQQAVRIFLKDGRKLEAWRERDEVLHPDANPYEKLVEKFKDNATLSGLVDDGQADQLVRAIEHLDKCESVAEFIEQYLVFDK